MNIIDLSFSLININININIDEKYKLILTIIFVFIFIHKYQISKLIYNYFYEYCKFNKSYINNLNIYEYLNYSNKKVKTNQIEPKQSNSNDYFIEKYYYVPNTYYYTLLNNPSIENIQTAREILENCKKYIAIKQFMRENNRLNQIYDTLLKK